MTVSNPVRTGAALAVMVVWAFMLGGLFGWMLDRFGGKR